VGDWRNRPGSLGWLSLRQLMDRFGRIESLNRFGTAALRMGQRAEQIMSEAFAAIRPWQNLPTDQQRALGRLMLEATMEQVHVDVPFEHEKNAHLREDDIGEARKTYARLRSQWNALSKRAQEVYQKVRDVADSQWRAIGEAMAKDIARAYVPALQGHFSKDEIIEIVTNVKERSRIKEQLKQMPLPVNVRSALRSLIEDAENTYSTLAQLKGPYFPLVRHGAHVVVAKSDAFNKAAKEFIAARDALQKLYDLEPPTEDDALKELDKKIEDARKVVRDKRAMLEALKSSDRHYSVTFFEHRWEADAYRKQLENDPFVKAHGMNITVEQRADHYRQFDGVSPQFVRRLEEELRKALPRSDLSAVQDAVREVYLRSLPDKSALKSELRRLNVPGAKATEMMRGFAQRSMGNAFRISRMEYGGELHDALADMSSGERDEIILADELKKRLLKAYTPPQPNRLIDGLAQITHMTYLGLSPSYALVNASQPWVISLPIMAARHGWARSAKALGDASLEVMRTIRSLQKEEYEAQRAEGAKLPSITSWRFDIQPEKLGKTDAERRMLRELFNDGLINITIEHDLGTVASGASKNALDLAAEISSTPAHIIEIVNRVATALAAFRMEMSRASPFERAKDYATQVVADTHFDYSGENAPRLMRSDSFGGLGRLVWQFKKYMQGMLFLSAKLGRDALKGDAEARRAFAYLHGMIFAVAGAGGLPLAADFGLLLKAIEQLWDDDDEPDLAQMFYNGMKDAIGEPAARTLMKGLPAALGIDLSGRLAAPSLTQQLRYAQGGKEGRDQFNAMLVAMLGPSAGMLANWYDAAAVADVDPARAWQMVLPKVFADPLRAIDRADRGILSRSGTQLVPPEEAGGFKALLKAAGFESTDVTDMYEQRAAFNEARQRAAAVRDTLLRRYAEARMAGKPVGEIMDDIAEFNRRNPSNRITPDTLRRSIEQRRKAQQETVNGVRIRRQDRDLVDQVM
jgi:hypothetical protein